MKGSKTAKIGCPNPELVEGANPADEPGIKSNYYMIKTMSLSAALLFAVFGVCRGAAQDEPLAVRVAVVKVPPFVMEQNGELTGFSIDLWNSIAAQMKVRTSFEVLAGAGAVEEAMRYNKVDVSAAPVVATAARDRIFDFSLPMLETGLQVLVRDTDRTIPPSPLQGLLLLLFSRTTAVWLSIAFLIILIPAHMVWLFERRKQDSMLSTPAYVPGIFEAMYWAVSCLTTQAEVMPRQWLARIVSVFWMFAGVVFVAFYTAQLTTTLTVQQIRGSINGPGDLPGKSVATVADTSAADYLRSRNARVQTFERVDQMFQALLDKKVEAAVFEAPVLLYYAAHEGKGRVRTVGPLFDTTMIAALVHVDSPIRRKIDEALLMLREDGTYDRIYAKWFGAD